MSSTFNLKAVISAVDRVTGPLRRINAALRGPIKAVRDVAGATRRLGAQVQGALGPLAALTGAGGLAGVGLGVRSVVGASSEFERFRTILETVEGSAAKARASMDWVSGFAARTPYELAEVTDAFVKLKAYGIDPQSGALKAAGDAAAAMGKPLSQAVEAMADALTGENERLKEFGIKAETAGNIIRYRWTQNGRAMVAEADKNSQAQIQTVLRGIWNGRYAGAMDKLAGTWSGMWSNLKDAVTRVQVAIGDAGLFDFLKAQLAGVLALLERMAADGSLQRLAQAISDALVAALTELRDRLAEVDWRAVWEGARAFGTAVVRAVEMVGGLGNALIVLVAILNAQTIVAVGSLVAALGRLGLSLGSLAVGAVRGLVGALATMLPALGSAAAATWAWTAALLANPVTWVAAAVIAAVAVIASAAYLLWTHWEPVKAFFAELWLGVVEAFDAAWARIRPVVELIAGAASRVRGLLAGAAGTVAGWLSGSDGAEGEAGAPGRPGLAGSLLQAAPGRQQLEGEMVVRFENTPPGTRVEPGRTNQRRVAFNPDVGYRTMALGVP